MIGTPGVQACARFVGQRWFSASDFASSFAVWSQLEQVTPLYFAPVATSESNMAVPSTESSPKTVFVSVSTGPSTKNTAYSLVCSALSPLIIFSVFAEVYLIFYDIDRAISKKWMFLLLLVTLTLNITLNSTFEKPYKVRLCYYFD